jgi:hypothetical protein
MNMYKESVGAICRLFRIAFNRSATVSVRFTLKDLFFIIGASQTALNVTRTFCGAVSVIA